MAVTVMIFSKPICLFISVYYVLLFFVVLSIVALFGDYVIAISTLKEST